MSGVPLLLIGAGGHARACIDVVESEGRFVVAGLVGQAGEVGREICGYPVLGTDADLPALVTRIGSALVVVGQIKTPDPRIRLYNQLLALGAQMPAVVSARAHVSRHARIGIGTIVMHGAVVNAGAVVGRNGIVNTLALVEHDSVVGDHCHVSTGAILNSGVTVGDGTFIGSQSCVRQGTSIGARSVIGMGQLVLRDCEPGTWRPLPSSRVGVASR